MTAGRAVAVKLAGFALGLLVVFAVGYGVGAATEPDAPPAPAPGVTTSTTMAPGMDMEHGS